VIIFLFQGICLADYYKWEDEQGTLHVTDYPPPTQSAKNTKIHQYEPEPVKDSPAENQERRESSPPATLADESKKIIKSEVVMYSTSWCPYCQMARDYFNSRNISFTDYDIEKDKEAAERKKQLQNGSGVPFVIINGEKITGFSPDKYERALQKNP
jgi:glutaredoxin-like YruB-family protein